MIIGGWFNVAGGQPGFGNIARWDGNSWHKFGNGLNGLVRAVAVDANGNVYAGGNFIFTGAGLQVNYVAKWNGSSWEALSGIYQGNPQTGVNQQVYALGIQSGIDVYIGGTFIMVEGGEGGNPRGDGLMVWRPGLPNKWDDYVTGPGTPVYAIEVKEDEVYLGGNFYRSIVSTYNGSQFNEFGNGVDGAVRAITFEDQGYGFYIAGDFVTGSGLTLNRVAEWDGLSWNKLCDGVNGTVYGVGYHPVPQGAQGYPGIYVGGEFTSASGVPAQYLARWDTGSDQQGPPGSNQKKSKVAKKIWNLIPGNYKLSQNYPNPFNPVTNIQYALSRDGWITLKVYDVSGKLVSVLVDEFQEAGEYRVRFDAVRLPANVYFYRLTSGSFGDTKKMLLVK